MQLIAQLKFLPRAMLIAILFALVYLFIKDNGKRTFAKLRELLKNGWIIAFLFYAAYMFTSTIMVRYNRNPTENVFSHLFFVIGDTDYNNEIIKNILFFVPFTFLYILAFKPRNPVRSCLLLSLSTTMFIEFSQLVFSIGEFQIADLIDNLAGGMYGCFLWLAVKKMEQFSPRVFFNALYWKAVNITDFCIDIMLTGCRLEKGIPNNELINGVYPTRYLVINHIFTSMVEILASDSFLDIGCGTGRVMAYLTHKVPQCKLTGVDFNETSIAVAKHWSSKRKNIHIYQEDALRFDYRPYTVLNLLKPFPSQLFQRFVDLIEEQIDHPIKVIYMSDLESGYMLKDRAGWNLITSETIFKLRGFQAFASPQKCSIWVYSPIPMDYEHGSTQVEFTMPIKLTNNKGHYTKKCNFV